MKRRIIIVDDEPLVLESLRRVLRGVTDHWDIQFIASSTAAWEYLQQHETDVVLTDLSMPVMSGLDLVRRVRSYHATHDVPVVVLTGSTDVQLKSQALDCGATDLLNKPIHPMDLIARIRSALRLKSYQDELKLRNEELELRVQERTQQLQDSRREIIWRLSRAAELRDEETGNHVVRVAAFSRRLALVIGQSNEFAETLYLAAPLHDVGKIGISDLILHKAGPLTEHERQIMQTHCEIGERILQADDHTARNGSEVKGERAQAGGQCRQDPVLKMAQEIAASHHERWDGTGYPRGLSGEQIPLAGRIVAVADVYDALTSARRYKPASPPEQVVKSMGLQRGAHFDPHILDGFLGIWPQLESIRERLCGSEGEFASQDARAMSEECCIDTDPGLHTVHC